MEIIDIFAEKLYAIKHPKDVEHVYKTLLDNWTDVSFVRDFVKTHQADLNGRSINSVVKEIIRDTEQIEDDIIDLCESKTEILDSFFKPLGKEDYGQLLPREKGRVTRISNTRIYAVKIESNCYVITGGALKFTRALQQRPHTQQELNTINKVRDYLIDKDVIDKDSFIDFKND